MLSDTTKGPIRVIGRYALHDEIASGGMATVHFGRLVGPEGFSRTVAIKRLHPQFAKDPSFSSMFMDEARLAVRIRHPNVVPILDVIQKEGELFLVMEYIQGEALSKLHAAVMANGQPIPLGFTLSIMTGVLHGLHAAHEARSDRGEPLGIVHRDVSPQNILVGVDGVARVLDFGVAKAANRASTTADGSVKGKPQYMAIEQVMGDPIDRRTDVYAASVVLWECLTGRRLFQGEHQAQTLMMVVAGDVEKPSALVSSISPELDAIVMRGLSRNPAERFSTAREMARALEKCGSAPLSEIGEWVEKCAGQELSARAEQLARIESSGVHFNVQPPLTEPPPAPSSSREIAPPKKSPAFAIVLAALLLLGAIGAVLVVVTRRSTTPPVVSASPVASEPAAPPPSISVEPVVEAPPPTASIAVAESSSAPPPATTTKPVVRPANPASVPPKPNCNPPYVIDDVGNRKYKRECLKPGG